MTRLYFEPITVDVEGDQPLAFTWRDKVHHVTAVLKHWIVRVEWWRQEVIRQYYKVECADLGTYEIYQERDQHAGSKPRWFLERLYD